MSDFKPLVSSAPAHSILNPRFHYTNSVETDVRRTFQRILRSRIVAREALNGASNVQPLAKKAPAAPPRHASLQALPLLG